MNPDEGGDGGPTPPPSQASDEGGDGGEKTPQGPPAGGGGEGSSGSGRKKRGRPPKAGKEAVGEASAEGERPRKKAEFHAPEIPRPCSECGKHFMNYKALFGHMRSHPKRSWRGAYPPPISTPSSPIIDNITERQGEQLASSLLSIGQRLLEGSKKGGDDVVEPGSSSRSGVHPRGLDIDLNMAQEEPVSPEEKPPSPAKEGETKKEIDLNKDASDEGEGA